MSHIIEKVPIESVNLNPQNPRKITDEQFSKLKDSIQRFPKMLELRPLVLNDKNQVIGGNMRLMAMIRMGFKEVHVIKAADLTPDEIRQFIILDNVSFGMWDYDMLANVGYDHDELVSWGMPDFDIGSNLSDEGGEEPASTTAAPADKKPTMKISFETVADLEAAQPEIEVVIAKYKATLSVSAGEI